MSKPEDLEKGSKLPQPTAWKSNEMLKRVKGRYRSEGRFKAMGFAAICAAIIALVLLVGSIFLTGIAGFSQTYVKLDIYFDPAVLEEIQTSSGEDLENAFISANYAKLTQDSLRKLFPEVKSRREVFRLFQFVSPGSRTQLQNIVREDPGVIGKTQSLWILAADDVDMFVKGKISRNVAQSDRKVSDLQIGWIDSLSADGRLVKRFNWRFFSSGDSREPELAGIWGATVGSFYTLLVTLIVAFPIGVLAAIYLEEFAPQNKITDIIEVNINNLAAVPSIVFGLLGLAIFLNVFQFPRSAPVVGGLTLALMTLPTIIIAARAAIKAVPPSIRDAATGLGASPNQVVFHHVLPLSMPGIMTGTIIGMAQALGETAPLLMIGMVAFVVDIPQGIFDASTALPVQIFLWADSPERAFVEKTSAAIIVLLAFLVTMNGLAIWLRQKFERRW
ncbi:MAG: phosphate ABC transporter, permease protein PstA [Kordiimonas sp.]|nr:phosphate ABC transporter, permease protein PstA [Kordiimonas sp.]